MASYRVSFRRSVAKDLRKLPRIDNRRILERIDRLAVDPRPLGCVKLSDNQIYRVRQGVYRIVYEIRDKELVVTVIKVGHRSAVYQRQP